MRVSSKVILAVAGCLAIAAMALRAGKPAASGALTRDVTKPSDAELPSG